MRFFFLFFLHQNSWIYTFFLFLCFVYDFVLFYILDLRFCFKFVAIVYILIKENQTVYTDSHAMGIFSKLDLVFGVMECRHSDVFFIFSAWYMRIQTKLPNAKLKMIHSQNSQINKKKIFVNVISRVSQLYIVLYSE